jgi:hypothetical protein
MAVPTFSERVAVMLRRVPSKHESIFDGPQEEDSRVVRKGVPKSETARRFGVDRATAKRYRKQLDERSNFDVLFPFVWSSVSRTPERWALLMVRELLLGPKRFTDPRAGLPSVS